jgi:hypothetical protein
VDADAGQYTFYIHDLEDPESDEWGLMIGDCLHNARTALDYLMVRLFSLVTGDKPRLIGRVEFPICDDRARFDPKSGKTAPAVAEMRKHRPFSGYLARIEELQPFNYGNPSVWGTQLHEELAKPLFPWPVFHELPKALGTLSALDNLDKHRVIHAAWLAVNTATPFADPPFIPRDFEFRSATTYRGTLEDGAKIGTLGFTTPLPHEWHPSEVDMKRYFPVEVAIYDESGFTNRVLEVLPRCLWAVSAVLTLFAPVFEEPSKPPLPVTVIPNPSQAAHRAAFRSSGGRASTRKGHLPHAKGELWAESRKSCVQKADCARIAEKRLVDREGAGMALARVVSFEGVSKDRMEEMRGEMRESERPEGLPATEVVVLHDPEAETSLVVLFFESENDYRRGDEMLNAMPAGDTPGQRSSVTKYEVAMRMTP